MKLVKMDSILRSKQKIQIAIMYSIIFKLILFVAIITSVTAMEEHRRFSNSIAFVTNNRYYRNSFTLISPTVPFAIPAKNVNGDMGNHNESKQQKKRFDDDDDNCNLVCKEEDIDYVGAGTLGDIMSEEKSTCVDTSDVVNGNLQNIDCERSDGSKINNNFIDNDNVSNAKTGLVTTDGGTLQSEFGPKVNNNLSPLDRIALTANGNLQRIFSSYYDAPVHVHVDRCERIEDEYDNEMGVKSVWERQVTLSVFGEKFCTANSNIIVHSKECKNMIDNGEVGIGQIFRYLDKLPKFKILDAGRCDNGGLWRRYVLECDDIITCDIHEQFIPNAWEIQPRGQDQ